MAIVRSALLVSAGIFEIELLKGEVISRLPMANAGTDMPKVSSWIRLIMGGRDQRVFGKTPCLPDRTRGGLLCVLFAGRAFVSTDSGLTVLDCSLRRHCAIHPATPTRSEGHLARKIAPGLEVWKSGDPKSGSLAAQISGGKNTC